MNLADGAARSRSAWMIMPTVAVSSAQGTRPGIRSVPGRWRCRRSGRRRSCARGAGDEGSGEEHADDRGGERAEHEQDQRQGGKGLFLARSRRTGALLGKCQDAGG